MTHFLDEQGNIPSVMSKEGKEMATFLALLVDATTKFKSSTLTDTKIRCFNKGCHGEVKSSLSPDNKEIHWFCPICENEGEISHWQDTRWNNLK